MVGYIMKYTIENSRINIIEIKIKNLIYQSYKLYINYKLQKIYRFKKRIKRIDLQYTSVGK